jgi:hypothetical protein
MFNYKTGTRINTLLSTGLLTLGLPLLVSQSGRAQQPEMGTVQNLTMGDRACYVEIIDDQGMVFTEFANFDICQQDLVGKQVQLTYESGDIIAASCQGDPECEDTETVMLITDVEVLLDEDTSPSRPPISELLDGNYRYWNGTPSGATVSDDELLANGGVTFTFRKQGNNVTGVFGYVDGEAVCVQGQVNGNTVTGISVQNLAGASVISAGDTFESFGPSGYLMVRRGRQLSPNLVRYNSTLLDLSELNRINAGTRVPPRSCT